MWMPLRASKMNGFILGFHRLVWCPKWTPGFQQFLYANTNHNFPLVKSPSVISDEPSRGTRDCFQPVNVATYARPAQRWRRDPRPFHSPLTRTPNGSLPHQRVGTVAVAVGEAAFYFPNWESAYRAASALPGERWHPAGEFRPHAPATHAAGPGAAAFCGEQPPSLMEP